MADTGARSPIATGHPGFPGNRTPAQWYCLAAGISLFLAGFAGFFFDAGFSTGEDVGGDKLIIFEVNAWHNLIHLASGALLVAAAARVGPARTAALAFGAVYGLVTVVGIIDGSDVLGLIPINPPDNVLHVFLSLAGLATGLLSPSAGRHPESSSDEPARPVIDV